MADSTGVTLPTIGQVLQPAGADPQTPEQRPENGVTSEDIKTLKEQMAKALETIGTLKGDLTGKAEMLTRRSSQLEEVKSTLGEFGLESLEELKGYLAKTKTKMSAADQLEHERRQMENRLQRTEKQLADIQKANADLQKRDLERNHNAELFKMVDKMRCLPQYRNDAFRLLTHDFAQIDGKTVLKDGGDPDEYLAAFAAKHSTWIQGRFPAGGDTDLDGQVVPKNINLKSMSAEEKSKLVTKIGAEKYIELLKAQG